MYRFKFKQKNLTKLEDKSQLVSETSSLKIYK